MNRRRTFAITILILLSLHLEAAPEGGHFFDRCRAILASFGLLGKSSAKIEPAKTNLLVLPGQPQEYVSKRETLDSEDGKNSAMIAASGFGISRGLYGDENYVDMLPSEFSSRLAQLGPNQVWLDLGAGNAVAVRQYAAGKDIDGLSLPPADQRAKAIAYGYDKPVPKPDLDELIRQRAERQGTEVYGENYGRFFQDISDEELAQWNGKIDLISALIAVPSYLHSADYPTQLLRILKLLAPGGVYVETFHADSLMLTQRDGTLVENLFSKLPACYKKFFSSIGGFQFVSMSFGQLSRIAIKRVSGPISIPEVVPLTFKSDNPPLRSFHIPLCFGE